MTQLGSPSVTDGRVSFTLKPCADPLGLDTALPVAVGADVRPRRRWCWHPGIAPPTQSVRSSGRLHVGGADPDVQLLRRVEPRAGQGDRRPGVGQIGGGVDDQPRLAVGTGDGRRDRLHRRRGDGRLGDRAPPPAPGPASGTARRRPWSSRPVPRRRYRVRLIGTFPNCHCVRSSLGKRGHRCRRRTRCPNAGASATVPVDPAPCTPTRPSPRRDVRHARVRCRAGRSAGDAGAGSAGRACGSVVLRPSSVNQPAISAGSTKSNRGCPDAWSWLLGSPSAGRPAR